MITNREFGECFILINSEIWLYAQNCDLEGINDPSI